MSLSSNMWTSVSGLLGHASKMGIIGNNIANISTIGFKGQRMDFEDFMYQNGFSASGPTQMGRGVGVSTIMGDFSQGGTESTTSTTDLLIAGSGYFQVKDPYSDQVNFTRAGNFSFDREGVLRSPSGWALQGWEIPGSTVPNINISGKIQGDVVPSAMLGTGNPQDIRFNSTTLEPRQTAYLEMTVQLNHTKGGTTNDKTVNEVNPMFSMFNIWDGSQPANPSDKAPIAEGTYSYSSSTKIYDEGGTPRTISTYYDQVNPEHVVDLPEGWVAYEYVVTMNPSEDMRTYGGKYDKATGTLKDDFSKLTDPSQMSAAKANLTKDSMAGYSEAEGGTGDKGTATAKPTIENMLFALNSEIDRINGLDTTDADYPDKRSKLTAANVGVVKYPSKDGWYLDPSDPNVKRVADDIATTPVNANANNIFLASASKRDLPKGTGDPVLDANGEEVLDADGDPVLNFLPTDLGYDDANTVRRMAGTASAGVLMIGTMFFDSGGKLVNQSAYTYQGAELFDENGVPSANPSNLDSWQPAPVSSSGYPVFTANFSGHPLANAPHQNAADDNPIDQKDGASYLIEYNLGLKSKILSDPWIVGGSAADVGNDYKKLATFENSAQAALNPSTAYGSANSSNAPLQDGYSYGSLSNHYIDQSGVLYGVYSNGQTNALYQVSLFDFVNDQGLRREGGNMFSTTAASGQPSVGAAGQNGLGTINGQSLEQSNVDLGREFVQMISTQRGYQANSKSITTTDSMLETIIGIVR